MRPMTKGGQGWWMARFSSRRKRAIVAFTNISFLPLDDNIKRHYISYFTAHYCVWARSTVGELFRMWKERASFSEAPLLFDVTC